jgi:hypothetical protein
VIVDNLNLVCVPIAPHETKTPLIIDTNTVLSFAIAPQRLQAVPRRRCQVAQFCGAIQLAKLPAGDLLDGLKATAPLPSVQPLSLRASERPDH